jgi:hypothetical protein
LVLAAALDRWILMLGEGGENLRPMLEECRDLTKARIIAADCVRKSIHTAALERAF